MNNSSSFKTKLLPINLKLNIMNLCQIYKLQILQFMFKYKIKLFPTVSKTTLQLVRNPYLSDQVCL